MSSVPKDILDFVRAMSAGARQLAFLMALEKMADPLSVLDVLYELGDDLGSPRMALPILEAARAFRQKLLEVTGNGPIIPETSLADVSAKLDEIRGRK